MLIPDELRLLRFLGRRHFENWGAIIDGGCFLGGSTTALAEGVLANAAWQGAPRRPVIHSFDRFRVEDYTIPTYFPPERAGTSFRAEFDANTERYRHLLEVHDGDITAHSWAGEPIEILFIDVAKTMSVNDHVIETFFPSLVPGHSLVVQQDYLWHEVMGWLQMTMEFFADCFEIVTDTQVHSVVFLTVERVPVELASSRPTMTLRRAEIERLLTRAADRFSGEQRTWLQQAAGDFMDMLAAEGRP